MSEFNIEYGSSVPMIEQETIITYDKGLDEWCLYTDNPVHARKWERVLIPSSNYNNFKRYHEDTGALIAMDGQINGSVSIRAKRELTEKEKQLQYERMEKMREFRQGPTN